MKFYKLHTKLLLIFLIFFALLIILFTISINIQKEFLKESILTNAHLQAELIIKKIEHNIYENLHDFRIFFLHYSNHFKNINTQNTNILISEDSINNILKKLINNKKTNIDNIIIMDDNKRYITKPLNLSSKLLETLSPWLSIADKTGYSLGPVLKNDTSGNIIIPIIIKLQYHENKYSGTAIINILASDFFDSIDFSINDQNTWKLKLIDGMGKLIYAPNEYNFLENINNNQYYKELKQQNKTFTVEESGIKILYTVSRAKKLAAEHNIDWYFLIGFNEKEILATLNELHNLIIVFTFILVIVCIIIATVMANKITYPITLINKATKRVSNGDLTTLLQINVNDEIGELASNFNFMVKSLNEYYQKIESHTQELESINKKLFEEIKYRKEVESSLNESKKFLEILIETIPNPIFYKDSIGVYIGCNKAFENFIGLCRDDIKGITIFDIFPHEQAEVLFNKDIELFNHPGTQVYESPLTLKDNTTKNVICYNATFNDYNNNVAGIIGILLDISERKKYENFLKIQKEISYALASITNFTQDLNKLLHIILDFGELDSGCLLIKEDGSNVYKEVTGINNKNITQLVVNPEFNEIQNDMSLGKSIYVDSTENIILFNKMSSLIDISFCCLLPISYSNNVIGYLQLATKNTVTISHNTKTMIENIATLLGEIFARIFAEREKKKIMDELARSNEELEQFAYIASHDLQEPLRKVITYGDFLKNEFMDTIDEDGQYYINTMIKASRRMSKLINNLLEYSRITTRGNQFNRVNLDSVIEDVIDNLEIKIKELDSKIDFDPANISINGDRNQLIQLFQNILSNSLKYHKPGVAPEIHIKIASGQKNTAIISISDNGIGFDEKYCDKIFLPFQRLHTKDQYEGTGIGLAICKKIIHRHNGSIKVTSTVDQGSTFSVSLKKNKQKNSGEKNIFLSQTQHNNNSKREA